LSSNYTKNKSLKTILGELKETYETSNQLRININMFPLNGFETINENTKHQLYRIAQELLKNVSMHAKATEVDISLTNQNTFLSFILEDNGVGFSETKQKKGIGFENIRERIASVHGTIHVDSIVNKGTIISIEIPN
jgi:signal transduction histidine kinase